MTKMSGWKIIEEFFRDNEDACINTLKDETYKDLDDIQASRKLLKFIEDFRELFTDAEYSAQENRRELKIIEEGKE
jgi:hypothetical protein